MTEIARRVMPKKSDLNKHFVYLMTNASNTVVFTGRTNNLERRLQEHRKKRSGDFAQRDKINKLVYFESFSSAPEAQLREHQIKTGPRRKKDALISLANPDWLNLQIG